MSIAWPAERTIPSLHSFDSKCMNKKCKSGLTKKEKYNLYLEKNNIAIQCGKTDNPMKSKKSFDKWIKCFDKIAVKHKYNKLYKKLLSCGKTNECYKKSYINYMKKQQQQQKNNKTKSISNLRNKIENKPKTNTKIKTKNMI